MVCFDAALRRGLAGRGRSVRVSSTVSCPLLREQSRYAGDPHRRCVCQPCRRCRVHRPPSVGSARGRPRAAATGLAPRALGAEAFRPNRSEPRRRAGLFENSSRFLGEAWRSQCRRPAFLHWSEALPRISRRERDAFAQSGQSQVPEELESIGLLRSKWGRVPMARQRT